MQDEIMGSIYCQVSDDFQRGLFPIARTVKAECHDLAVVVRGGTDVNSAEVKVIGQMDNTIDNTFESANRVYDSNGLSPTIPTCGGGGIQPKILVKEREPMVMIDTQGRTTKEPKALDECPTLRAQAHGNVPMIVASRGRNPDNPSDRTAGAPTEQRLEINTQGTSNCLTSVSKDNMVLENAAVLTPKRTEYGKAIRKAYESGEVHESRHNMTELEPRTDGVSNTLTTVQKDNMILQTPRGYNNGGSHEICPSISSNAWQENNFVSGYRIRKLTPRSCGRLMNVFDEDISKMELVNSNSQLYKQFGNSICCNVLIALFSQLNIQGITPWNKMSEIEKGGYIYDKSGIHKERNKTNSD